MNKRCRNFMNYISQRLNIQCKHHPKTSIANNMCLNEYRINYSIYEKHSKSTILRRRQCHVHNGRCVRYGNPLKNSISDKQALALTKKVIAYGKKLLKHEQSELRRGNPVNEHLDKFIRGMKTLERYAVGSKPYIDALAKTYADLQVAKAKMGK